MEENDSNSEGDSDNDDTSDIDIGASIAATMEQKQNDSKFMDSNVGILLSGQTPNGDSSATRPMIIELN